MGMDAASHGALAVISSLSCCLLFAVGRWHLRRRRRRQSVAAPTCGARDPRVNRQKPQQPRRDKTAARLEWWQRLNEIKPELTIPELPPEAPVPDGKAAAPAAYTAVANLAYDRLGRGRDWLVRDSDYVVAPGSVPAHAAIKSQVNAALVKLAEEHLGPDFATSMSRDPRRIVLLLDTPNYGTLRELASRWPELQCCQQVIVPQADLGHYFDMLRGSHFYPGVRAQRLDHWLCANAVFGFQSQIAFFDYECRLAGAIQARLCPAADVMRYFRFGYPAKPVSIFGLTVGLEEPAGTPEEVDAFVRYEASLSNYAVKLVGSWKYRMVTLLYIVRRI